MSDISTYQLSSLLQVLQQEQAMLAGNMSTNVAGYKQTIGAVEGTTPTANGEFSDVLSAAVFPVTQVQTDFAPGPIVPTGRQEDMAVHGDGVFFAVEGPAGEILTRNGRTRVDAKQNLIDVHGNSFLTDGGPIQIDATQGPVVIGSDGTLSQGVNTLGKLKLVHVKPADLPSLQRAEGGFKAPDGLVEQAEPEPGTYSVQQFAYEGSNANSVQNMAQMSLTERNYKLATQQISTISALRESSVGILSTN